MTPNYHLMLSKLQFWDGCFSGEGCVSVVLSNQPTQNTYCKIEAIDMFYHPKNTEEMKQHINNLLKNNNLDKDNLDAVMLGYSGSPKNDSVYEAMAEFWGAIPQLTYKQFSGEYFTASAFGIKLAAQILKTQTVPENVCRNKVISRPIQRILFHQHFHNQSHAIILLSLC
jgi:3-oxoacyl-(acyl-carrier-protein) synthase